jgi:hypothetical protein
MHFHGMYQMSFFDKIGSEPGDGALSGFLGDVLAGDDVSSSVKVHSHRDSFQILDDWFTHWPATALPTLMKIPVQGALLELREAIENHIDTLPGSLHQKMQLLELRTRQRFFTNFQSTLSDYWRGAATPFLNRAYARFCLSLPRLALDNRQLLSGVFRRYYGKLAVIPGTYANEPMILTGRYLFSRRIAKRLPKWLRRGPFAGFENVQLRMSVDSARANGRDAFWPLFDTWEQLSEWLDVGQIEGAWQSLMRNREDYRSLSKLQAVQTIAYRLLEHKDE